MEMAQGQLRAFNARFGAFSELTEREIRDGQLTLTDEEKAVLASRVPPGRLWRGPWTSAPLGHELSAPLYRSTTLLGEANLKLHYPKLSGNEVRLYFSKEGFSPESGDVWFIFVRSDNRLCVGWHEKASFTLLGSGPLGTPIEDSDEDFQTRIEIAASVPKRKPVSSGYRRDVKYALEALANAGFQCELDPSHSSFTSARTGKPFMEAHHIVPVSAVRDFPSSTLDVTRNIVSLCPNCHRRMHLAVESDRIARVRVLLARRPDLLPFLAIPESRVLSYYQGAGPLADA